MAGASDRHLRVGATVARRGVVVDLGWLPGVVFDVALVVLGEVPGEVDAGSLDDRRAADGGEDVDRNVLVEEGIPILVERLGPADCEAE